MNKKPEIELQNRDSLQAVFDKDLAVLGCWPGIRFCSAINSSSQVSNSCGEVKID
ncbi:MAG: hypothetical protein QNJ65_03530 [Xenococcaceae cyanobacterium MO_234.B1]|nr:hypothetical protein [Xenococcaceae cyanobacterium MO_234.B1]